jgi:hypothetical protein
MPTAPEVLDSHRKVRSIEIQYQFEAQQRRDGNRHVRITGKIAEDLDRVEPDRIDRSQARITRRMIENLVYKGRDIVRNAGFLDVAQQKKEERRLDFLQRHRTLLLHLRNKILRTDDRARYQLRKERREHHIVAQACNRRNLAPVDIDRITQGLEREEAHAHWKDDSYRGLTQVHVQSIGQRNGTSDKEMEVLEEAEY